MVTITVCMIVKNEAAVLSRCLDSLKGIADELVIVDTGSTDDTKSIAAEYTEQVYDFAWVDDFSAARNFAFSKCHMDYIYSADADEVLDEENRKQFLLLKEVLDPQVEIVQMYYANQLEYATVYNFDKEYRPKLYKRLREFVWEEPVHETVRMSPVVFDSDIVILHCPQSPHAPRDFKHFQKAFAKQGTLSNKLLSMYARELYIAGDDADFEGAQTCFAAMLQAGTNLPEDLRKSCECVLAHAARCRGDVSQLMTMSLHNAADGHASSEMCYELGLFYASKGDWDEAYVWFLNAAYETQSVCNIHYGGDWALERLAECARQLGDASMASEYERLAKEWELPNG